nr:MAG TPA: hypothetical protein [Caudoviricetes sp.]
MNMLSQREIKNVLAAAKNAQPRPYECTCLL